MRFIALRVVAGVLPALVFTLAQTGAQEEVPKAVPVEVTTKTAGLRIAVVDLEAVFAAHPEAARAQESLNDQRQALRDVFKEKSEALKEALQKHQEEIRAGQQEAAVETLKQVNELEKAIATLRSTQQRELEERFAEEKERVLALVRQAVAAYNAEPDQGYDLVLDASASAANGFPMVVDAPGADDLTEALVERVRSGATAEDR